MIVGIAIVLLAVLIGVAFYLSYKSHKIAYMQEGDLFGQNSLQKSWKLHFWHKKEEEVVHSSPMSSILLSSLHELKKNKLLGLKRKIIFNTEESEIFDVLHASLPLTHIYLFSHCSLLSFVEYLENSMVLDDFCKQHSVHFLIVGKKSKTPLMAIDYMRTQEINEADHIAYAAKKLLLQHVKIPYILIKREVFMKEDKWDNAVMQEWVRERIISKFKV